jgi:hypothetical protein
MSKLQMSLIQNSISFATEALSKAVLADQSPSQWKFAILSLIQAIELAIKERLRREHSVLIFANIDDPKHSVSLEISLKRLIKIGKVNLSERDINAIHTAREWRNLITHYEFEFSIVTIKSVFAILFGFYLEFNRNQLQQHIEMLLPTDLWTQAIKINTYFEELKSRAVKRIQEENIDKQRLWSCKVCNADTVVVHETGNVNSLYAVCYTCGYNEDIVYCAKCMGPFYFSDLELIQVNISQDERLEYVCRDCFESLIVFDHIHSFNRG